MKQHYYKHNSLILNRVLPFGFLAFMLLYLYSSTLYPGGSQADPNSVGFDWGDNYWCNLMSEESINGQVNPARKYAIAAMMILCFSLSVFFYQFTEVFVSGKIWNKVVMLSGILSMISAVFIFSELHDLITLISSGFGLVSIIGIVIALYKSKLSWLKGTGLFCLILLGLNNIIYYSSAFIEWLPLLQKVTMAIVLTWLLLLNQILRKRIIEG